MQYIKAGGQERPYKASYSMVTKLCKDWGCKGLMDFAARISEVRFEDMPSLIYEGFRAGHLATAATGAQLDFNKDTVIQWLDEDMNLYIKCVELVSHYIQTNLGESSENGADEKKA
jgi:hypothetical protein